MTPLAGTEPRSTCENATFRVKLERDLSSKERCSLEICSDRGKGRVGTWRKGGPLLTGRGSLTIPLPIARSARREEHGLGIFLSRPLNLHQQLRADFLPRTTILQGANDAPSLTFSYFDEGVALGEKLADWRNQGIAQRVPNRQWTIRSSGDDLRNGRVCKRDYCGKCFETNGAPYLVRPKHKMEGLHHR